MSVERHIASALRLAAEDLVAAKALAAIGNRNDAYHAQQAAEKMLLALLTAEGVRIERKDSHRLDVLRDLLPDENPLKASFGPLVFLTAYATTYRYPKDAGRIPDKADRRAVEAALAALTDLLEQAAAHFGVDLAITAQAPAKVVAPPRS